LNEFVVVPCPGVLDPAEGGLKALSTHSRTGLREKAEGRKEHRGMGEKMGETRKGKAVVPHFLVLQNNCR